MTTDTTDALRQALAERFPWARRDCETCDSTGSEGEDPIVAIATGGPRETPCHVCGGRGYLPLPEPEMLAAVLRACPKRGLVTVQGEDGTWVLFRPGNGSKLLLSPPGRPADRELPAWSGGTLFEAFLAATEGERDA